MLKKIGLVVVALILVLVVVIATRPGEFRIERSTTVSAPAATVFPLVNDFHNWAKWNPFSKADPSTKVTVSGAASGVGARYEWVGEKSGSGSMEIVESRPNEYVKINLSFTAPMKQTNVAEFTFKPAGTGTSVSWAMSGENNFVGKAFSLVMNMDKMVGGEFEKGLADIKKSAEAESAQPPTAVDAPK